MYCFLHLENVGVDMMLIVVRLIYDKENHNQLLN
jgi:hypothetical protein